MEGIRAKKELSRLRLNEVFAESGLTQAKFAESLNRKGFGTHQQTVRRYLIGENEIPHKFAVEVYRVYGCRVSWLLGDDDFKTDLDESAYRLSKLKGEKDTKRILFNLLAQMSGWRVDYHQEDIEIAAPVTGNSEAFDGTEHAILSMNNYVQISKGKKRVTFDQIAYEQFVEKQLDYFTFEMNHSVSL